MGSEHLIRRDAGSGPVASNGSGESPAFEADLDAILGPPVADRAAAKSRGYLFLGAGGVILCCALGGSLLMRQQTSVDLARTEAPPSQAAAPSAPVVASLPAPEPKREERQERLGTAKQATGIKPQRLEASPSAKPVRAARAVRKNRKENERAKGPIRQASFDTSKHPAAFFARAEDTNLQQEDTADDRRHGMAARPVPDRIARTARIDTIDAVRTLRLK